MSTTAQGPGWWLASDGKWYPPELWTAPPKDTRQPTSPAPGTPPDPASGGTVPPRDTGPASGPGYAGYAGYAGYGAGNPSLPYGQIATRRTNGLAIAALICGCAGFLFFVPGILGIIFGFVARGQIKGSNGQQTGNGMAIAGIIVGAGWLAFLVLVIALGAAHPHHGNSGVVNPAILLGGPGPGHVST